ncbi:ubiquitin-associated domain-containing protein 2-like [Biomphalaria glabrata]|uniref:Ubiquitin-associated domain-containing protein 2-like n=1 Tax=Biomphalaria glabrata TaxID=6526 RepID=A0A9W2YYE8_BIOGL|nr:ubiquitin-associated domain-containing protein 2-like [Biomphalaria glabrata]KAI8751745.1 ubiquitin-associated domain-containing protein 2 [Biomphalaria glabrata]
MIALSGPSGFHGAPVTKFILCHAFMTYLLFSFPLQHFQYLFRYNQEVLATNQFKRMFFSKLVFLDLPDLLFTAMLIYNFRMFERRFGSRKFVSHLLATLLLGSLLELMAFAVLNRLEIRLGDMPTGLFSLVFPLYVPLYCTVPRVALVTLLGVPVTGKTINYILGLQMATSRIENLVVVACALVSGILWRVNFLKIQKFLQVPKLVGNQFDYCLGRFLESPVSKSLALPMGATLELQQRERMDRLEQQMMMSALQASRRVEIGRPQPLDLAAGSNLFDSLNMNRHIQRSQSGASHNIGDNNVSEEQVRRFVEMGFSDERARQALRSANNNPTLATNFLLQNM